MSGQHRVLKASVLRPADEKPNGRRQEAVSSLRAELSAVFLAVIWKNSAVTEELNSGKCPYIWVFTDPQAVTNGLAIWSYRSAVEIGPPKGMATWGVVLWKLEMRIKVGHVDVHQKNSFPGLEGVWNWHFWFSLEMVIWGHEMSVHGSLEQSKGGLTRHVSLSPLRHRMTTRTVLSASKGDRLHLAVWRIPWGEAPELSWQAHWSQWS